MQIIVRDKAFYRSLAALAVPICLQNFLTYGVAVADNVMVGQLGERALGGLYVGVVIHTVLMHIIFGVTQSAIVLATQYWGAGRLDPVRDIAAMCLRIALVIGGLFAVTSVAWPAWVAGLVTNEPDAMAEGAVYLRIVGASYILFAASQILLTMLRTVEIVVIGVIDAVTALALNIGLNWILIYGHLGAPALGVGGAAYATLFARAFELLLIGFYLFRIDHRLEMRPKDLLRRNARLMKDLAKYGTPIMLGQMVWAINVFGRGYFIGRMSQASIAAASIAETVDGLLWMFPLGIALACGILTGKTIGEGRLEDMKVQARTMQLVFLAIGIATALSLAAVAPRIPGLYGLSPEALPAASAFLAVVIFTSAGRCYQAPSLMGLVKAGGDTSFVFLNDTFWVFCWILPGAWLLQRVVHAPDWAVYAILLSDQVTKCFVAVVKINRFKWMKRLVAH